MMPWFSVHPSFWRVFRWVITSAALMSCCLPPFVRGQERLTTELTLNELIQRVLERNEGIQGRILEVEIARKKALAEKGIFEPEMVTSYDRVANKRRIGLQDKSLGIPGQVFSEHNNVYNAGLEGLIPSGAKIKLGYSLRDNANNINPSPFSSPLPYFTNEWVSFAGLSATQPLLKNFGFTTSLAGIRLAALASDIAFQEYRRQLMILISTAEASYWNLYMAQEQMLFFKESVGVAETILKDNQSKVRAGKGSELEVLEAEAGLGLRRSKQSDAREKFFEAISRLNSLYADTSASSNRLVVAIDVPEVTQVPLSYQDSYLAAVELNPDYLGQTKKIASENIRVAYAKNQRLPQLDLKASYGLNGLGHDHDQALHDMERRDFPSWSVGVELHVPITGGIRTRNELDAAKLKQKQALVALKEIETQVGTAIDIAMRKVRATQDSVRSYQSVVNYSQNLLAAQMARLEVGKVESRKVLEVDADLFEAKNSMLEAQVQFRRALLELELIEGTLLKTRNLDLTQRELESKTALLLRKGEITDEEYADFVRELQWQFQQKSHLDGSMERRARQVLREAQPPIIVPVPPKPPFPQKSTPSMDPATEERVRELLRETEPQTAPSKPPGK
jgi:outer membrane protein TolC